MKILYATDGFPASGAAGRLIAEVADPKRVEVSVVSVAPHGSRHLEHIPLQLDPLETRRQQSLEIIDAASQRLESDGFKVEEEALEGDPSDEILRLIESEGHDLAVVGSGSRTWLGNILLGSVSTAVLHASPSSVLVVHAYQGGAAPRIVIGADGSRGAELATRNVIDFADPQRCQVEVVSIIRPPEKSLQVDDESRTSEVTGRVDDATTSEARGGAEQLQSLLHDAGFHARARTALGHPSEQMLHEAQADDVALIALGSTGRGRALPPLMGSVSDQVVRHARATLVARRALA
ncbi:MAG: universal stress protein [Actinomycetota bacterium]|nr:universal stress protein [Actinomycetota bacterium]